MKFHSLVLLSCSFILGYTPSESAGAAVTLSAPVTPNTIRKPNMPVARPFSSSVKGKPLVAAIRPKSSTPDRTKTPSVKAMSYGGWDQEQVPDDAPPTDIYEWDQLDNQKYIPNPLFDKKDVPKLDTAMYNDDLLKANDGYLYAIDARRPRYTTNSRRQKVVQETNETPKGHGAADSENIEDIVLPGSLKYRMPKYSNDQALLHQAFVYFGQDGETACRSLKILLEVDGAESIESIPDDELFRPQYHYFAVVVKERNDGDLNDRKRAYAPKYLRLNQGGIWSFKEGTGKIKDFILDYDKNVDNLVEYTKVALTNSAFPQGKFCGLYKVPSSMKAYLEKARRR